MSKKEKEKELNFSGFLQVLNVHGLIESCKIEPKNKGWLFSQVVDPDNTIMGEIFFKNADISKKFSNSIVIYDIVKLLSMVNYVDQYVDETNLSIETSMLEYGSKSKNITYRLGDPEILKNADLGRTMEDFKNEQHASFVLNNEEIKELLHALSISEKDSCLAISVGMEKVKMIVGKHDKVYMNLSTPPSILHKKMSDVSVLLQTSVLQKVLKTILMFPEAELTIFCRPEFPAVFHLSSGLNKILTADFLIAPIKEEDF